MGIKSIRLNSQVSSFSTSIPAEYIVIGGGGAGGCEMGGGGGAGGYQTGSFLLPKGQNIDVVVGRGGRPNCIRHQTVSASLAGNSSILGIVIVRYLS